jgi:DHA1 family tetracycline resistance protein-like MFS transporter
VTLADGATTPGAPAPRRALAFIFVAVALDMLALGVIIPVLPKLVLQFEGGDTASAARIYGIFGTTFALMQLVFSPLLGALSDRFGRRPVLLLSILGLGLDYVLMALAPSLAWLFVGRVISGISAATFATAGAYIADVTPAEKRAASFGLVGAAFGLGFVLGPALGGLAGSLSPRLPFWIAAGLCLANAAYGLFVLPESLPRERRMPFSFRRAHPFGALRLLRSHPELFGLAAAGFLSALAHEVLPSVTVLYVDHRYGWDLRTVGFMLAAVGVCSALVSALGVRAAVARLGERRTLLAGLACGALGFAVYGGAASGAVFWLGVPLVSLWGVARPTAQGLMTRRVAGSEQGQLQGALASVVGLSGLVGPLIFTWTFAAALGAALPGAPFLLAGAMLVLSLFLAARATRAQ